MFTRQNIQCVHSHRNLKFVFESTCFLFNQEEIDTTRWDIFSDRIILVHKYFPMQKCMMTCEACASVVVYNLTGVSRAIFYGAGDRPKKNVFVC